MFRPAGAPHYLAHICGFALAALFCYRAFPNRRIATPALLAALAVATELWQWYFYNRLYWVEWWDILADLGGIAAGAALERAIPIGSSNAPRRAHWVHHSPSPYQAALYRSLNKIPGLDFQVHHVLPAVPDRPWQSSFTSGYRERSFAPLFWLDWRLLTRVLREKNSFFVLACWGEQTNQIAMLLASLLGRRYAMWNDTPNYGKKRHAVKAHLRTLFLRTAFRGAHSVMGTGKPALHVMTEMGCPAEKLVNFPCFIDPYDYPAREKWYAPPGPMEFVSAGRLVEDKGYSLSLEALARVFRGCPGGFRYRVLGTGSYLPSLMAQAQRLGISEQVQFMGWVEPAVSKRVLEEADVFLHPSHFEPFGVVIAEAMAAGLVVIASNDTAAAVDRIENGENGFLHETGMTGQVCQAIQRLLDRPEEVRRIGMAARRTAEQWPLERAQAIFQEMLAR